MVQYYIDRCKKLEKINTDAVGMAYDAKQMIRQGNLFDAMDKIHEILSELTEAHRNLEAIIGNLELDRDKHIGDRKFLIKELMRGIPYEDLNNYTDFELLEGYMREKTADGDATLKDMLEAI